MPTTIGRNRRQYIINIKSDFTACLRYDPDTGAMVPADANEAWDILEAKDHRAARLIESDDRTLYTIRFGKVFYELRRPS